MAARLPAAGKPTAPSEHFAFFKVDPMEESRPAPVKREERLRSCTLRPKFVTRTDPEPVACGGWCSDPDAAPVSTGQSRKRKLAFKCWPQPPKGSCGDGSDQVPMLRCPQLQTSQPGEMPIDQECSVIHLDCHIQVPVQPPPRLEYVIVKEPRKKIHRTTVCEIEEVGEDVKVRPMCKKSLTSECEKDTTPRPVCVFRRVNVPTEKAPNRPWVIDHRKKKSEFVKRQCFIDRAKTGTDSTKSERGSKNL